MGEAGARGYALSSHSSSPASSLGKMFVGTWHPSVTVKAARGEQKAPLAVRKQQRGALRIDLPQAECSELQRRLDQLCQPVLNSSSEQMTVIWP